MRVPLSDGLQVFLFADYIRTFTWDKKLEMVVKSTGILGGQGKPLVLTSMKRGENDNIVDV